MLKNAVLLFSLSCTLLFSQVKKDKPVEPTVDEYLNSMAKNDNTINALIDAVKQGNSIVKAKSIEALSRFEAEKAYPIFKTFLGYGVLIDSHEEPGQDASWLVRANSAVGLGKLKKSDSAPFLHLALIREENPTVKKSIIYALGEIGNPESINGVVKEMETTRDEAMVLECVMALGKIGDKKCFIPLLLISTGNYLPMTKREAIKALENIKW